MNIKNYFKKFIKTAYKPNMVFRELLEENTAFHAIYYMTFNFIFGTILVTMLMYFSSDLSLSQAGMSPVELTTATLISMPLLLISMAIYFEFVQSMVFKLKSVTLNYFKLLLWSFHYFIISFFITSLAGALLSLAGDIFFYLGSALMIYPFLYLMILFYLGLKHSCTKTHIKTLSTLSIGILFWYIPVKLLA